MIRIIGLRKTYGAVVAVDGLSFEVAPGEVFGFIGPNGAGKTTTIKMLTGLVLPTGGEAWVNELPALDPDSRAKLGFLPEGTFFHDYLTGAEFLHFHGSLLGIPKDVRRERGRPWAAAKKSRYSRQVRSSYTPKKSGR